MPQTKYMVQLGDNLSKIAATHGTTWEQIAKANGIKNPNLIYPNQELIIPTSSSDSSEGNNTTPTGDSTTTTGDAPKANIYPDFNNTSFNDTDEGRGLLDNKNSAYDALAGYGDPNWSRQSEADALVNDILSRPDFTYDINADALYQQYKDKYIQQGKMAMADVMGQASAMTGGYGNSYAATVGNQAYQSSLQNLNDIVPELYQMAYDRYNQEGQDMRNNYGMLMQDYDKYMQEYKAGYGKLTDAYDIANSAYYNAANLYGTEQDRGNGLLQTNYENVIKERQLAMAEEKHDAEMKALAQELALIDNPNGDDKPKDDEPEQPDEKPKGWEDHDTKALEENQEKKGGSYYVTARKDVDSMISKGASYKELMAYAQEMVGNSYLSKSEYMTLVQYIRNKAR